MNFNSDNDRLPLESVDDNLQRQLSNVKIKDNIKKDSSNCSKAKTLVYSSPISKVLFDANAAVTVDNVRRLYGNKNGYSESLVLFVVAVIEELKENARQVFNFNLKKKFVERVSLRSGVNFGNYKAVVSNLTEKISDGVDKSVIATILWDGCFGQFDAINSFSKNIVVKYMESKGLKYCEDGPDCNKKGCFDCLVTVAKAQLVKTVNRSFKDYGISIKYVANKKRTKNQQYFACIDGENLANPYMDINKDGVFVIWSQMMSSISKTLTEQSSKMKLGSISNNIGNTASNRVDPLNNIDPPNNVDPLNFNFFGCSSFEKNFDKNIGEGVKTNEGRKDYDNLEEMSILTDTSYCVAPNPFMTRISMLEKKLCEQKKLLVQKDKENEKIKNFIKEGEQKKEKEILENNFAAAMLELKSSKGSKRKATINNSLGNKKSTKKSIADKSDDGDVFSDDSFLQEYDTVLTDDADGLVEQDAVEQDAVKQDTVENEDMVEQEEIEDEANFSSDRYGSCSIIEHRRMKTPYTRGKKKAPNGYEVLVGIDDDEPSWLFLPDVMSDFCEDTIKYGKEKKLNHYYWKQPSEEKVSYWFRVTHINIVKKDLVKKLKKKSKYTGFLCTCVGDNGFTSFNVKSEDIPKSLIDNFIKSVLENDNSD